MGAESDIVHKEMYSFEDRNGDSLTLRPEGTASLARAVVSNGLLRSVPLRFFYSGPMFRHERPQKGRYRQFHQLGVELIGINSPLADVEVIALAWDFLLACGFEKKIQLEINNIGQPESRKKYKEALVDYFSKHRAHLSEDSLRRLSGNPFRILDSKDEGDRQILSHAPLFEDFMDQQSKASFRQVKEGLKTLGIPFVVQPYLVRGLDYYTQTVFEFTTEELGASQNAILSGGRYHGLIKQMGGRETMGVGWAAGLDRLVLLADHGPETFPSVGLVWTEDQNFDLILKTLKELRDHQIPAQPIESGNLSNRLKKAHKRNCTHVIIAGTQELQSGNLSLKDLKTGEQREMSLAEILSLLKTVYKNL